MKQKTIFFIVIIVLVLGVAATILKGGATSGGKYDGMAVCLKEKGATFYGAFWCPHCLATKKLFGSSAKLLPYVECSTKDGKGQTQACIDKKIKGYPTWTFDNGVTIESDKAPHKCTDSVDESKICQQNYNTDFDTWVFDGSQFALVGTNAEPVNTGNVWTFVPGSMLIGEVTLDMLSKQTSCTIPQ